MVIYANKVIKFTFLPINHRLFMFTYSFSLHIFIRPFGIIIQHKKLKSQVIPYVISSFYNFLCISLFFLTYVFYCFCCFISFITTIQLFWPQNKHLNFKQDWITNVLSIFRKNDFYICFVHKSRKWAIFGLTCKDKRSRDLVTVGPIFEKNRFKRCVRLESKKSWKENFISAVVSE